MSSVPHTSCVFVLCFVLLSLLCSAPCAGASGARAAIDVSARASGAAAVTLPCAQIEGGVELTGITASVTIQHCDIQSTNQAGVLLDSDVSEGVTIMIENTTITVRLLTAATDASDLRGALAISDSVAIQPSARIVFTGPRSKITITRSSQYTAGILIGGNVRVAAGFVLAITDGATVSVATEQGSDTAGLWIRATSTFGPNSRVEVSGNAVVDVKGERDVDGLRLEGSFGENATFAVEDSSLQVTAERGAAAHGLRLVSMAVVGHGAVFRFSRSTISAVARAHRTAHAVSLQRRPGSLVVTNAVRVIIESSNVTAVAATSTAMALVLQNWLLGPESLVSITDSSLSVHARGGDSASAVSFTAGSMTNSSVVIRGSKLSFATAGGVAWTGGIRSVGSTRWESVSLTVARTVFEAGGPLANAMMLQWPPTVVGDSPQVLSDVTFRGSSTTFGGAQTVSVGAVLCLDNVTLQNADGSPSGADVDTSTVKFRADCLTVDVAAEAGIGGELSLSCGRVRNGTVLTNVEASVTIDGCAINTKNCQGIAISGLGASAAVRIVNTSIMSHFDNYDGSPRYVGAVHLFGQVESGSGLVLEGPATTISTVVETQHLNFGVSLRQVAASSNFTLAIRGGASITARCNFICSALGIGDADFGPKVTVLVDGSTITATSDSAAALAVLFLGTVRFGPSAIFAFSNSTIAATTSRRSAFAVRTGGSMTVVEGSVFEITGCTLRAAADSRAAALRIQGGEWIGSAITVKRSTLAFLARSLSQSFQRVNVSAAVYENSPQLRNTTVTFESSTFVALPGTAAPTNSSFVTWYAMNNNDSSPHTLRDLTFTGNVSEALRVVEPTDGADASPVALCVRNVTWGEVPVGFPVGRAVRSCREVVDVGADAELSDGTLRVSCARVVRGVLLRNITHNVTISGCVIETTDVPGVAIEGEISAGVTVRVSNTTVTAVFTHTVQGSPKTGAVVATLGSHFSDGSCLVIDGGSVLTATSDVRPFVAGVLIDRVSAGTGVAFKIDEATVRTDCTSQCGGVVLIGSPSTFGAAAVFQVSDSNVTAHTATSAVYGVYASGTTLSSGSRFSVHNSVVTATAELIFANALHFTSMKFSDSRLDIVGSNLSAQSSKQRAHAAYFTWCVWEGSIIQIIDSVLLYTVPRNLTTLGIEGSVTFTPNCVLVDTASAVVRSVLAETAGSQLGSAFVWPATVVGRSPQLIQDTVLGAPLATRAGGNYTHATLCLSNVTSQGPNTPYTTVPAGFGAMNCRDASIAAEAVEGTQPVVLPCGRIHHGVTLSAVTANVTIDGCSIQSTDSSAVLITGGIGPDVMVAITNTSISMTSSVPLLGAVMVDGGVLQAHSGIIIGQSTSIKVHSNVSNWLSAVSLYQATAGLGFALRIDSATLAVDCVHACAAVLLFRATLGNASSVTVHNSSLSGHAARFNAFGVLVQYGSFGDSAQVSVSRSKVNATAALYNSIGLFLFSTDVARTVAVGIAQSSIRASVGTWTAIAVGAFKTTWRGAVSIIDSELEFSGQLLSGPSGGFVGWSPTVFDGLSLEMLRTTIHGTAGAMVRWPADITGTSPQTIKDVALSPGANASLFVASPNGTYSNSTTLCLENVTNTESGAEVSWPDAPFPMVCGSFNVGLEAEGSDGPFVVPCRRIVSGATFSNITRSVVIRSCGVQSTDRPALAFTGDISPNVGITIHGGSFSSAFPTVAPTVTVRGAVQFTPRTVGANVTLSLFNVRVSMTTDDRSLGAVYVNGSIGRDFRLSLNRVRVLAVCGEQCYGIIVNAHTVFADRASVVIRGSIVRAEATGLVSTGSGGVVFGANIAMGDDFSFDIIQSTIVASGTADKATQTSAVQLGTGSTAGDRFRFVVSESSLSAQAPRYPVTLAFGALFYLGADPSIVVEQTTITATATIGVGGTNAVAISQLAQDVGRNATFVLKRSVVAAFGDSYVIGVMLRAARGLFSFSVAVDDSSVRAVATSHTAMSLFFPLTVGWTEPTVAIARSSLAFSVSSLETINSQLTGCVVFARPVRMDDFTLTIVDTTLSSMNQSSVDTAFIRWPRAIHGVSRHVLDNVTMVGPVTHVFFTSELVQVSNMTTMCLKNVTYNGTAVVEGPPQFLTTCARFIDVGQLNENVPGIDGDGDAAVSVPCETASQGVALFNVTRSVVIDGCTIAAVNDVAVTVTGTVASGAAVTLRRSSVTSQFDGDSAADFTEGCSAVLLQNRSVFLPNASVVIDATEVSLVATERSNCGGVRVGSNSILSNDFRLALQKHSPVTVSCSNQCSGIHVKTPDSLSNGRRIAFTMSDSTVTVSAVAQLGSGVYFDGFVAFESFVFAVRSSNISALCDWYCTGVKMESSVFGASSSLSFEDAVVRAVSTSVSRGLSVEGAGRMGADTNVCIIRSNITSSSVSGYFAAAVSIGGQLEPRARVIVRSSQLTSLVNTSHKAEGLTIRTASLQQAIITFEDSRLLVRCRCFRPWGLRVVAALNHSAIFVKRSVLSLDTYQHNRFTFVGGHLILSVMHSTQVQLSVVSLVSSRSLGFGNSFVQWRGNVTGQSRFAFSRVSFTGNATTAISLMNRIFATPTVTVCLDRVLWNGTRILAVPGIQPDDSCIPTASSSLPRSATASPLRVLSPTASTTASLSGSVLSTRTSARTTSENQTASLSGDQTPTEERTETIVLTPPPETPRPAAVPAQAKEAANVASGVASVGGVVSPLTAVVAVRGAVMARASDCGDAEDPMPDWPTLAAPLGWLFSTGDWGVMGPDIGAVLGNGLVLIIPVLVMLLVGEAVHLLTDRGVFESAELVLKYGGDVLVTLTIALLSPSMGATVAILAVGGLDRPDLPVSAGNTAFAVATLVFICVVCGSTVALLLWGWRKVVDVEASRGEEEDPEAVFADHTTKFTFDGLRHITATSATQAAFGSGEWEARPRISSVEKSGFLLWLALVGDGRVPHSEATPPHPTVAPFHKLWRYGGWWVAIVELSVSVLHGIAAGLARAGHCTVGPWMALITQILYVGVLLTVPLAPVALWAVLFFVQSVQLLALALGFLEIGDAADSVGDAADILDVALPFVMLLVPVIVAAARILRCQKRQRKERRAAMLEDPLLLSARDPTFDAAEMDALLPELPDASCSIPLEASLPGTPTGDLSAFHEGEKDNLFMQGPAGDQEQDEALLALDDLLGGAGVVDPLLVLDFDPLAHDAVPLFEQRPPSCASSYNPDSAPRDPDVLTEPEHSGYGSSGAHDAGQAEAYDSFSSAAEVEHAVEASTNAGPDAHHPVKPRVKRMTKRATQLIRRDPYLTEVAPERRGLSDYRVDPVSKDGVNPPPNTPQPQASDAQ